MWNLLIGPLVGAVSGYFKDKAEIKKAKVVGEVKLIQSASDNIADWEQLHAKGSQTSWKDEFWTLIFAVPLVLGFCGPWGVEVVSDGFAALQMMPQWYQYTLVTMVLASFGIRMKAGFMKK